MYDGLLCLLNVLDMALLMLPFNGYDIAGPRDDVVYQNFKEGGKYQFILLFKITISLR